MGRPAGRAAARPAVVTFVYVMWMVFLLQPQWLVASFGPQAVVRVPLPFFVLLMAFAVARIPRTEWYLPLLAVVVLAAATIAVSPNIGRTLDIVRALAQFWVVAVVVLTLVRTPRQAQFIVLGLMLYSYVWWVLNGSVRGLVSWHPELANYDGYGPLVVAGAALSGFAVLAIRDRKLKLVALATALLCVFGLVSTFTRGALLAAGVVLIWAWIRSPRKGAMAVGTILVILLVAVAGSTIFANVKRQDNATNFFDRVASIAADISGTGPGATGTGADRRTIWTAARIIFQEHPLVGVGFGGFGPTAATTFSPGTNAQLGTYADNPNTLYDKALHSAYYQILCEQGIAGVILWLWLVVDFFKRNAKLRQERYRRTWAAETGGSLDLRFVALGLEAGMVAFLACAYFYNLLTSEWFYGILITNRLLHQILAPRVKAGAATVPGHRRTRR